MCALIVRKGIPKKLDSAKCPVGERGLLKVSQATVQQRPLEISQYSQRKSINGMSKSSSFLKPLINYVRSRINHL